MKNIQIQKIFIEGFGSISKAIDFSFSGRGTTIIRGHNGAGKTTLFTALYWCLFGKHLKGVLKANIPTFIKYRGAEFKGTKIALTLVVDEVTIQIQRTIKYKGLGDSLGIWESGEPLTSELYQKDQQKYIDNLLGLDGNTFLNSIMFGQRMKRLISSTPKEKRDLLEELFNLFFVGAAKDVAKEEAKAVGVTVTELEWSLTQQTERLVTLKEKQSTIEEYNTSFTIDKEAKVAEAQTKLEGKQLELHNLEQELLEAKTKADNTLEGKLATTSKELNEYEAALTKCKGKHSRLEADINNLKGTLKHYATNLKFCVEEKDKIKLTEDCLICGKELSNEQAATKLARTNSKIEEYGAKIQEATDSRAELQNKLTKVEELTIRVKDAIQLHKAKKEYYEGIDTLKYTKAIPLLEERIKHTKTYIEDYTKELTKAQQEQPTKHDLAGILESIEKVNYLKQKVGEALPKKQKELEAYNFWIKKGFASGGLKAYVFSSMLDQLNHYINKYAGSLGLQIRFTIDLTKATKPFVVEVYKDNSIRPYDTLSGGEQQLSDVIIAFALHDLVSANTNIDCLIFDEVFEGLDEENRGKVFDFMRIKAEGNKNLFIISHDPNLELLYAKVLEFTRDAEGTKILA